MLWKREAGMSSLSSKQSRCTRYGDCLGGNIAYVTLNALLLG